MVHNGTWGDIRAKSTGGFLDNLSPNTDKSLIEFRSIDITNAHESYVEFHFDVPVYNLNFYYIDINNGGYTGPEKTIIEGYHNGTIHAPITTNFKEDYFPEIKGAQKNIYEGKNASDRNIVKVNFKQPVTILKIKVTATTSNDVKIDQSLYNLNYSFCRDTDLDLIPDSLDLDSDNDGCADAVEGGGYLTTSNLVADTNMPGSVKTNLGTTVNANGIPVIAGVGQTIGDSQDNNKTSFCTDTDSDGVNNYNDLDDDNDGILDFSEMTFFNSDRKTGNYNTNEGEKDVRLNYDFSGYDYSQGQDFVDVIASASNISATNITLSISGTSGFLRDISATTLVEAKQNLEFLVFNFTTTSTFEVGTIDWIFHNSTFGDNGAYKFTVSISEDKGVSFTDIADFAEVNSPSNYFVNKNITDYTIKPGTEYQVRIYFYDVNPYNTNTYIVFDDFQLIFDYYQTRNSDFDSLSNHVDLDADDDGCADAIEGGGGFSNGVLVESTIPVGGTTVKANLGTTVDANGVPTIAAGGQTTGHSQNATFSSFCTDTDTDGVNDFIDIDDDNDGIIDKLESDCEDSGKVADNDRTNTGAAINLSYYFTTGGSTERVPSLSNATDYITSATNIISDNSKISTSFSANSIRISNVEATTLEDSKSNNEYLEFQFSTSTSGFYEGAIDWVSMWNPEFNNGAFKVMVSVSSDGAKTFTDVVEFNESANPYPTPASGDYDTGVKNVDVEDYKILPNFTYYVRLYFYDIIPKSGDNYILFDDLQLVFDFCKNINTDVSSDAYPNRLDLDSDGDGCPDAIESAVPSALVDSGVNNTNGISINTPNSKIDVTADPVGANGFANSLESGATDSGTVANAYTTTNYTTYGLDNTKNGCGIPMITQVYQSTGQRWVEITNINSNIIVPNAATIGLYKDLTGNQDDVAPTAFLANTTEIAGGKTILFSSSAVADKATTATEIINTAVTDFDAKNDQIIISRGNGVKSYNGRVDIIKDIEDNTSYVRIDEALTGNATYTSSEWVAYVDDAITTYTNVNDDATERHVHAPLISQISSADDQANIKPGLHRVLLTEKTAGGWSNGFPDRSRHVSVGIDYNHTSTALNARKLTVHNGSILSITNQALVVSDAIDISTATDQIRLISSDDNNQAQLIQTHEGVGNITGAGRLLVDQNSETASVYRFNYFSSPVNSIGATTFTVADVLKDGTTALDASSILGTQVAKEIDFVAGYDGNNTDPIEIADYWIFTQAAGGNWSQKGSAGVIAQTDGFIMKGTGVAQNYTFSGSPKDGTLSTSIGTKEFYLVGNPYASSLSVKKFLEDNLASLTATAYFWQHAGEDAALGTQGHNYAGYIGGYATRNLSMGLKANDPLISGGFDINLEAEDATFTGISQIINGATVIALNSTNSTLEFANLVKGVDVLTLQYQSTNNKLIKVHVNGVFKQDIELTANTAQPFGLFDINLCVEAGSTVTLISNDSNTAYIDLLRLYDADGDISCSPSLGTGIDYKVPGPFVPIGQGFFIEGDAGGAVEFNNSQRALVTEGTAASVFFRGQARTTTANANTENSTLPLIKLGMDYLDANNTTLHRQLGVSFKATNTFAFDKGYDSEIFDINPTDVYWKFDNNNSKYVIAGVQSISDDLEIPLEIVIAKDQSTVVFGIDEIQQISNEVYILDKLTGHTHQITHNSAAIVLDAGVYSDRFAVTFKAQAALSTTQTEAVNNSLQVYYNTVDAIELVNKDNLSIHQVNLYSLVGQEVKKWKVTENNTQVNSSYKVSNLASGIYFVKVYTKDKQTISKKLLIE